MSVERLEFFTPLPPDKALECWTRYLEVRHLLTPEERQEFLSMWKMVTTPCWKVTPK